ncbi:DUF1415 domain-containing protein [Shewanella septentrionalis]|uniref:DUF1415 domain-containing protein n=1 Tax=Shewanella septentrionalis TaxID=2952223 RepID=A0A9X2WYW3_9GAMM|nr:DUF1415 domain-containing protein [Shewanella septentrionalis]MCT7947637.1 DUF1415 domain-containing protein [Shewanella septentrionalis]
MNEIDMIIEQTDNWVKKVIMKYNICPFARREVERGSIRYLVVEQTKVKLVLKALIEECQYLDAHPEHETTLFILPRGFEGFYTYLDLVDMANDALFDNDYEGVYQLAHFHPDYCFEDEPQDSAANFTNRAPYPTLHIIREASMELALASYTDPESIPERNIAFCERKGSDFFIKLLAECMGKS